MNNSVLIIGDSCMDIFIYCKVDRLCPDVPVPILIEDTSIKNGGMSQNVRKNIERFGVGCDLLTNQNWPVMTKTRYVHRESNHMFLRVDGVDKADPIDLRDVSYEYDAIIISDYNKGFLTAENIEEICNRHSMVFIDTKKILGPWARNAKFIKINHTEYTHSLPYLTDDLRGKIIHTMGSSGAEFNGKAYPVDSVDVKDASGAGDTFMAALVIEYVRSNSIDTAIKFANNCAREVVQHRGVVTI